MVRLIRIVFSHLTRPRTICVSFDRERSQFQMPTTARTRRGSVTVELEEQVLCMIMTVCDRLRIRMRFPKFMRVVTVSILLSPDSILALTTRSNEDYESRMRYRHKLI